MIALWIALGVLACFGLVLVVRAVRFVPGAEVKPNTQPISVNLQAAVEHLQAMVRLKTVSSLNPEEVDQEAFSQFKALLPTLYPKVHAVCTREEIGAHGLLYTWKGKSSAAPSVLMAHYDVVPAQEDQWTHPPFAAVVENEELWGRGTLDTKNTLLGIMEAAELLATQGFVPENDLYFAFGGDEEIMGQDAPDIVSQLEKRGVHPAFVLDEGGAVVEGVFPGVRRSTAVVGIAEKGSLMLDIRAQGVGGHASAPPVRQSLVMLARAVNRLQKKPMPFTLTKPAKEMFDVMGRHSTFLYRLIFANLWCFAPLLDMICKKSGGELNALVRTTCAFTRAQGASAYNVLPQEATLGMNLRIISGETTQQVQERIKAVIADEGITLDVIQGQNPSTISSTFDAPWNRLEAAIRETYPQALVAPYLMLAASDSRHYGRISDHVYRFSGLPLTKEQRGLIHNADERIPLALLEDLVGFFVRVLQKS